ncbi:MAG TPA: GNAT family N-acetyltransferase [Gammaproteobacteria bacterium]|nr:GNAT family N-acetyltransferase [Gammaproteobacteria bacterium]
MKKYYEIYFLKHIETPRLLLRPVQLGDEVPLNKALNNSLEVLQKWQAWAKDPSMKATLDFVQRGVFAWKSGFVIDFPMVIILKTEQKIIGVSGYNENCKLNDGLYEIGYWCDVDYQGQGFITECANALTRYAFHALNATKVILSMQVENKKSEAVATRLHFNNRGIKDRDPADCVSERPEFNYVYAINNLQNLPPLELTWQHTKEDNIFSQIEWAKKTLSTDSKAFASSKFIVKTLWSNIIEFNTGNAFFYLKHTPELIALDAPVIKILREEFNISVPKVIAHNKDLHCFLMHDAGRNLRGILKQEFNEALLYKAIDTFTSMQINVADHINVFLHIGVPDWRLDKLPSLYAQLLSQKTLLLADGLPEFEMGEHEALLPKVSYLCEKLSAFSIKQTIVQPDFNDNNMLVDDLQNITLIDLGEIAISHPFFSLLNCLQQMQKHYGFTETDAIYLKIKEACLKNYLNFESHKNILEALDIAKELWPVYGAVAMYRFMQACGEDNILSFQPGALVSSLKEFMSMQGD